MAKRRYFSVIKGGRVLRRNEFAIGIGAFAAVFAIGLAAMVTPLRGNEAEARAPALGIAQPRVIDGDTIEDLATGERIRLANVDTAEIRDGARCAAERRHGERARTEVGLLLSRARDIAVRRTGRADSYGRTIAYVLIDGRDLGRTLIAEGLARPWRGRREPWCGADGALLR
ncbi:nuclease [alpha proteobacterium U9-1i]|nr:nuclease [alpha proteobacterium U9-1i]